MDHYGVGLFEALNAMTIPAFAMGGLVTAVRSLQSPLRFAGGGRVPAVASQSGSTLNLTIGTETFEGLFAPRDTADRLQRYAQGRQLTSAGRKPGWHGG